MFRDTELDNAINEFVACVQKLIDNSESEELQEDVCLAARYALSLFVVAYEDANRDYPEDTIEMFLKTFDDAIRWLPEDIGDRKYRGSVTHRQEELKQVLAGNLAYLA